MLFGAIFFYSIAKLVIVKANRDDCKYSPVTTELNKFKDNVLGRHIRAVVFPKNAQLLLTPAFTKAILDGRPRGLLYSVEFDMYSPLPDTIDGWKPTILVKNHKKQNPIAPLLKSSGESIKTNMFQAYNESLPHHHVRAQDESLSLMGKYDYYNFPFQDAEEATIDSNWEWTHTPRPFLKKEFKMSSYEEANKFQRSRSNFYKQPYLENTISLKPSQSLTYKTDQMEWDYVHHDRERRQIIEQLELVGKIFKFNMKKCLRRAVCELTSHFRLYGESVMEDIVRLILFPSLGSSSYGTNYDNVNCIQHFAISCPYSIIDFLTKNFYSVI